MKHILSSLLFGFIPLVVWGQTDIRHWTVADGLPTSEVQQIIELPNGQMLINCEGVFCLSNGQTFVSIPCDRRQTYRLRHYGTSYGHLWQGDSLLWLRDFYRIYLFDSRTRTFRYDIEKRLNNLTLHQFVCGETGTEQCADSLGFGKNGTVSTRDRQGGVWVGTWRDGILYLPPLQQMPRRLTRDEGFALIEKNQPHIDGYLWQQSVTGDKYLVCRSLNQLGYYEVSTHTYASLNEQLPQLNLYRYFVGACPIDSSWIAVYSQNGAFLLNTRKNTLSPFPYADEIEQYSDKYNCMAVDCDSHLWVGTQNGLFCDGIYVKGLANNCIRSLVIDNQGQMWVGTSCGISCITPSSILSSQGGAPLVKNYTPNDGIPATMMTERAAGLTTDGQLVFIHTNGALVFRPEWLCRSSLQLPVVLTDMTVNGESIPYASGVSQSLTLPHDQNTLSLQFSALNYASPSHTHYRYRLLPMEKNWQNSTDGDLCRVDYRALSPGRYRFEAQTCGDDEKWGETMSVAFRIRPPWWLTWWAKMGYAILGVIGVMGILGLYLKRKKAKLERENDERVNRLFELREEARHKFAENTSIDPTQIGINSKEEELADQILRAIETHIADPEYGVDQLAQDVCMSRSLLYEKLRTMLGISPADFIRNVRLKRAAQLLSETNLPITEIGEHVGFGTHRAFSSNFKKMFGYLPSEYRTAKAFSR